MGSSCLFFSICPEIAILSDLNADLVQTYQAVRENAVAVHRALLRLPKSEECYYKLRSQSCSHLTQAQRAARFIYLNRYCFNGLYRTNQLGHFNVPYSPSRTGPLPSLAELKGASVALKKATIRCCDFHESTLKISRGDFVYLDPPFAVENRRVFRQYGPRHFSNEDLQRLSRTLDHIDKAGGVFLLSYAYCSEAISHFSKWPIRRVVTTRNISGFAKHRRKAIELLITNTPLRKGSMAHD